MKQKLLDQLDFWAQMEIDQATMRLLVIYLLIQCGELPL